MKDTWCQAESNEQCQLCGVFPRLNYVLREVMDHILFMWARDLAYLLTLIVSLNKGFRTADDTGICGSICGAVGGGIGGRIGTFGDRIGIGTYSNSL